MVADNLGHRLGIQGKEVGEKRVGGLHIDVIGRQTVLRKVFRVECDDDLSVADDRGGGRVSIVWINRHCRDEILEAGDHRIRESLSNGGGKICGIGGRDAEGIDKCSLGLRKDQLGPQRLVEVGLTSSQEGIAEGRWDEDAGVQQGTEGHWD